MVPERSGILYVVATPIGNLEDISDRARRILAEVDLIAAEDTRYTGRLLGRLSIRAELVSLHEHNERERSRMLLGRLARGGRVALVSDAGTPLVSDPGFLLVTAAREAGITVSPVPGPCAAIAALSVAGLPTDRFRFEGFLPSRAAARRRRLAALAGETVTLVFYEAPHRLRAALADLAAVLGGARRAVLARELTKLHESLYAGTLETLTARAGQDGELVRGELVLIIEGLASEAADTGADLEQVLRVLLAELPLAQAVRLAGRLTGERRNRVYQTAVRLTAGGEGASS